MATDPLDDDPHMLRVAEVVAILSDRLAAGEPLALADAVREFPECGADLKELWGTMVVTQSIGKMRVDEAAHQFLPGEQSASSDSNPSAPILADQLPENFPKKFGEFDLLEELGRGGMGVVYRARQRSLNRIVALKLILRGTLASEDEKARFRSEAESVAKLNHPNIVKVFQFDEKDGHQFLCMEYVEGETLAQFLERQPSWDEIAEVMRQVATGIEYAHQQGVLHRDLKPSNILLDKDGVPRVVDFGLAKHQVAEPSISTAPLTQSGSILGTPAYMAPEAASGSRQLVGPASDVYSLGAIIYYCLTGQGPFVGTSTLDTLLKVMEQEPVPPRELDPDVDRDLEMVALKCLQKPMDLRYHSARALADDLQAYLRSETMSARSGRLGEVIARTFRETHNATVLENWGLLWMWHSLVLFIACVSTDLMQWNGIDQGWKYFLLWSVGFGTWALVFWILRRRMGPVTFVERQIAHTWAASLIGVASLFCLEMYWGMPVLKLAPLLGIISGMIFLIKAGMLSGAFYIQAIVMFLTAIPMAVFPSFAHTLFGIISGLCFFLPGLKYYRQRLEKMAEAP